MYDRPPAVTAPPPPLSAWLRVRVLRLRQASVRRVFGARLEVVPECPPDPTWVTPCSAPVPQGDHGLWVDLLARLADAAAQAEGDRNLAAIHVRPGPPEIADADLGWWSAAGCTRGLTPAVVVRTVVVTRWGWLDVASGRSRTWARLRA
jgi:hypothetical protein